MPFQPNAQTIALSPWYWKRLKYWLALSNWLRTASDYRLGKKAVIRVSFTINLINNPQLIYCSLSLGKKERCDRCRSRHGPAAPTTSGWQLEPASVTAVPGTVSEFKTPPGSMGQWTNPPQRHFPDNKCTKSTDVLRHWRDRSRDRRTHLPC